MLLTTERLTKDISKAISKAEFGKEPTELYEPIRYIMALGGKRMRPLLTILSNYIFTEDTTKVMDAAIAVEVFHNFTLMHDDIMDNAPLRRGKATVHEKWNTNIAILSGDVMLVEAYKQLLTVDEKYLKQVLDRFNETAAGVCEGQQFDMNFESLPTITVDDYSTLTLALDFNKLLVPTQPDYDTNGNMISGKDPNKSVPAGIFGSFSDAPGGFSEEIKEVNVAAGLEYLYRQQFAFRTGYFYENPQKGDRRYFTLGAGLKINSYAIDFSYLLASTERSPLANTLRFSLLFNFGN